MRSSLSLAADGEPAGSAERLLLRSLRGGGVRERDAAAAGRGLRERDALRLAARRGERLRLREGLRGGVRRGLHLSPPMLVTELALYRYGTSQMSTRTPTSLQSRSIDVRGRSARFTPARRRAASHGGTAVAARGRAAAVAIVVAAPVVTVPATIVTAVPVIATVVAAATVVATAPVAATVVPAIVAAAATVVPTAVVSAAVVSAAVVAATSTWSRAAANTPGARPVVRVLPLRHLDALHDDGPVSRCARYRRMHPKRWSWQSSIGISSSPRGQPCTESRASPFASVLEKQPATTARLCQPLVAAGQACEHETEGAPSCERHPCSGTRSGRHPPCRTSHTLHSRAAR